MPTDISELKDRPNTAITQRLLERAASAASYAGFTGWHAGTALSNMSSVPALIQMSPKAAEAQRQIGRLHQANAVSLARGLPEKNSQDLSVSINMLTHMASAPFPIPVAGWSEQNGPNLFFDHSGFYGDLEISNDSVEYFLKWEEDGRTHEVFDTEEVEGGYLPQRLLSVLYRAFARTNAAVMP